MIFKQSMNTGSVRIFPLLKRSMGLGALLGFLHCTLYKIIFGEMKLSISQRVFVTNSIVSAIGCSFFSHSLYGHFYTQLFFGTLSFLILNQHIYRIDQPQNRQFGVQYGDLSLEERMQRK
jgi:hypothetical protein